MLEAHQVNYIILPKIKFVLRYLLTCQVVIVAFIEKDAQMQIAGSYCSFMFENPVSDHKLLAA